MFIVRPLPPIGLDHPNAILRFYYRNLHNVWSGPQKALGRVLCLYDVGPVASSRRVALGISKKEWSLALGRVSQDDMLTMRARKGIHSLINPSALPLHASRLKNKAIFESAARAAGLAVPDTFGKCDLDDWLRRQNAVMIKPNFSSKGKGVRKLVRLADGRWGERASGNLVHSRDLFGKATAQGAILQAALDTHPSLAAISPNALPTMRVVTMLDERDDVEVVARILRVGGGTHPVDNFSRGGLAALSSEVGGLGAFYVHAKGVAPKPVACHPAAGTVFPSALPHALAKQTDDLARLAHELIVPDHAIVGWDIGLSSEGAVLIEGNWNPGTNITQLLSGEAVCAGRSGELYLNAMGKISREQWENARPFQRLY